ncbi:thermonuclease family protein [Geminocystis sp. NIES-3709]|uniref:thermonuclease family protein n=1 Tax=Geminocystis sp. NIES-3709 TaxID=1617448 RepID=UPI0005FC40E2|nr:thermonuclease family protein [Geminocystis sp. NIES-3709]BAQ63289.1 Staphylococcus nuclease (SNase) domain [Geminocystis sp. NIES-3709]
MLNHKLLTSGLLIIFFCLCFGVTGCQNKPIINGIEGKIKRVVSAQTIEVIIENKSYQLRLAGLDIPSTQPQVKETQEAKQFLINFFTLNNTIPLNTSIVMLETDLQVKDKFDRLSGYVWYNDRLVNQELLTEGYAIVNLTYTDGKYDRVLIDAQHYARIMEKGIWNVELSMNNREKTINF